MCKLAIHSPWALFCQITVGPSDNSIFFNRKDENRTLKEAEKLYKLQDKNIVRYYDSGFAKFPDWEEWKEWLQILKTRLCILKYALC